MANPTQLERYQVLIDYLDANFTKEINISRVEEVSHYSYRNINRIFQAIHQESIGQYLKRLRLEKAAEFLKYTQEQVSDIALEVGFTDIAAFSKAFKAKFSCSPSHFRVQNIPFETPEKIAKGISTIQNLSYEIEVLPDFQMLVLEYRGSYEDYAALNELWDKLIHYLLQKRLLQENTVLLAQILDDNEIRDEIQCRYQAGIMLEQSLSFEVKAPFRIKQHTSQKYVKFVHQGSDESSAQTYQAIYAHWMTQVGLEFEDLPVIEILVNHHEENIPPEELLTEIYIPVK